MLKTIARIILGIVFLFSGFVKAVDPQGGAIKIAEYLEIVGMHQANSVSVFLAIALSTLEFIIGFMLFFGLMTKKAALPAFIFMSFFTVLTLYSAVFEPVSDCGCFGDAVKLTNWETFFKNLVLCPISYIIYRKRNDYTASISGLKQSIGAFSGLIFIIGISIYSLVYLPLLDFRPFKVGQNIQEGMSTPEDAPQDEYETTFIMEKNGERKEFDEDNFPYNDTTWVFIDQKSKLIKEGYQPPIQNFFIQNIDRLDVTQDILNDDKPVFLVIAPKVEKASTKNLDKLKEIRVMCLKNGYQFFVLTSSLVDNYFQFDANHSLGFDYLSVDETLLKTICRGNPGMIILDKGTIIAKYNHTNLPEANELSKPLSHSLNSLRQQTDKWFLLGCTLLLAGFILILYRIK
ncbi:BT_3928 family protein [Carboxylicivirga caseinilyticus]|uniref:BT_3928 family protein n=1 Tax=Carboxylicivirga caseinilyticus TaxID=3417572 RepID=UPI003D3362AA|nr:DoxX family protein [Marinilabiliaceae bacterium A049]